MHSLLHHAPLGGSHVHACDRKFFLGSLQLLRYRDGYRLPLATARRQELSHTSNSIAV